MTTVDIRDQVGAVVAAHPTGGVVVTFSDNLSLFCTEAQAAGLLATLGGLPPPNPVIDMSFRGLIPANNGTNGLVISPGQVNGIILTAGIAKTTAAWTTGPAGGLLDTGTIAANKGYHLFIIRNPTTGAVDVLASLSHASPVLPSGYTDYVPFQGVVTDGAGNIQPGIWYSNGEFRLTTAYRAINGAPGNFLTLAQLVVPVGAKLRVKGQVYGVGGGAAFWIIVRDPDLGTIPDVPEQWYEAVSYAQAGSNDGSSFETWTDASGQIYHIAYPRIASYLIYLYLQGWVYPRGESA